MDPIVLPSNRPADRFYRGGARIAAFRGEPDLGPRTPEDWVASTTTVRGEAEAGRTRLPDGSLLVDEIARQPEPWLGPDHLQAFGVDTKLLVKLLDAGQRLPVHAHPDTAFASEHVGTSHGKAEAWYLLTSGEVYLGLTQPVTRERLGALVAGQEVEELLSLMHRVSVRAGQTVWVPPGLLHAIGEGILLAEVQEPEDLSILLEWRDFALDGAAEGHLGLGFDLALEAVETRARRGEEIAALVGGESRIGSLLPAAADQYFLLERYVVDGQHTVPAGFVVLITLDGALDLVGEDARTVSVGAGSTTVIPYAAGPVQLRGHGTVLLARPPQPS
ncbi:MAG: class I mannose-6-phosphate isomerase [Actinomycetes bacterium]